MCKLLPVYTSLEGHKPKLGKSLTWVAGVQLLSDRFSHVPQFRELMVWFSDRPGQDRYRSIYDLVNARSPYQIVTVSYSVSPCRQWFLMVYPVESRQRQEIQSALQRTAFPIVDQWMCQDRPKHWSAQRHSLRCIYDPVGQANSGD